MPVGKEIIACLSAFKELGSSAEGRSALSSIFLNGEDSELEGRRGDNGGGLKIMNARELRAHPPLQVCWCTLLTSIVSRDGSSEYAAEAIGLLSLGSLLFCMDRERSGFYLLFCNYFFFSFLDLFFAGCKH